MNNKNKTVAIILSAGSGTRMGMGETKQTIAILGKSVLYRCLQAFEESSSIDSIVVVYRDGEYDFVNNECRFLKKPFTLVKGGKCRAESASFGFASVCDSADYVMIHDGARCLITPQEIDRVAEFTYKYGAATASKIITDTVKKCGSDGKITATLTRSELRLVQTPQASSVKLYKEALKSAPVLNESITDDNMLLENIGIQPYCVDTSSENIKITTREDLLLAEFIIKKREEH